MRRTARTLPLWVFAILFASYAFFWHSRDWNSASRLMLTYALVDRGTISIDGLEDQTRDRARFRGHFYSDKLPGFSLLAVAPTWVAKKALGLSDHPLRRRGFAYWPADYWATLGTSGLLTGLAGALLSSLATELGCGPKRAALVGLAYGLATPAYIYATLGYGHQACAFALLASFALLWGAPGRARQSLRFGFAGALAATAAVVELQVGLIAAILATYALVQVISRKVSAPALSAFLLGAVVPSVVLLGYNTLAFDSPWRTGYFFEDVKQFADVHSKANPLGLQRPNWDRLAPLLFGPYRGLFFFAPVLVLAIPGWIALFCRRVWAVALVSLAACSAGVLVNLSYPEWTGGWSTGPRLLVPILPFAMVPVAAILASGWRGVTAIAGLLAIAGWILMTLFQGVGGRVPDKVWDVQLQQTRPLDQPTAEVIGMWRGEQLPGWASNGRFARNLTSLAFAETVRELPTGLGGIQFLPLVLFQAAAVALAMILFRKSADPGAAAVKPPTD
jgi:hypothetical protein